jgi:hypothetical protein
MRIFKTRPFVRFAIEEGIDDDALVEAANRAEQGLVDADLGGGLIKQRVARKGEGKSGGFRTLLAFKAGDKVFFLHGFAKKNQDNVSKSYVKNMKELAKEMLLYKNDVIDEMIEDGKLKEISHEV